MVAFNSLQEFIYYIPQCVICRKSMDLHIEGQLSSVSKKKPRYNHGRDHLYVKLRSEYTHLRSVHKSFEISIHPETNEVTVGAELINRMQDSMIYVHKSCTTCHFKIQASFLKGQKSSATSSYYQYSDKIGQQWKENHFPPFSLREEELHYTLKGGVDVRIQKNYSWPTTENTSAIISLARKELPPMPLDFNKFEGMEHLNKRLATIKLFH